MCGVPADLGRIALPTYVLATREDHIVPWKTAYASARLLGGKIDFVLAASGHIAGVINPATRNRRNYWLNEQFGDDPERWLAHADTASGQLVDALERLARATWRRPGGRRARRLATRAYQEIEPAPGRYVKAKPADLI